MDLYMPYIEHTALVLYCLFQQSVQVPHEDPIRKKAERLQIWECDIPKQDGMNKGDSMLKVGRILGRNCLR